MHVYQCVYIAQYNWYRLQQQQKGPNPDLMHGQKTYKPLM